MKEHLTLTDRADSEASVLIDAWQALPESVILAMVKAGE